MTALELLTARAAIEDMRESGLDTTTLRVVRALTPDDLLEVAAYMITRESVHLHGTDTMRGACVYHVAR
jgi:hypothetical protein